MVVKSILDVINSTKEIQHFSTIYQWIIDLHRRENITDEELEILLDELSIYTNLYSKGEGCLFISENLY